MFIEHQLCLRKVNFSRTRHLLSAYCVLSPVLVSGVLCVCVRLGARRCEGNCSGHCSGGSNTAHTKAQRRESSVGSSGGVSWYPPWSSPKVPGSILGVLPLALKGCPDGLLPGRWGTWPTPDGGSPASLLRTGDSMCWWPEQQDGTVTDRAQARRECQACTLGLALFDLSLILLVSEIRVTAQVLCVPI